jgi:hypothetical protein
MQEFEAEDVDESLLEGTAAPPPAKVGGIYVRFTTELRENALKSWGGTVTDDDGKERRVKGEGRPVYEEIEYIELVTPGDRTNIPYRPVTDAERRKYAVQYKAWKAGVKEAASGTPLSAIANRIQVEELAYFKVRTVEQLADVSDGNLGGMPMYTRALVSRAKDYLAAAKGNAPVATLRAENEQLRERLSALEKLVNGEVVPNARKKAPAPAPAPADDAEEEHAAAVEAVAKKPTRRTQRQA